jgi:hypothetical protein
MSGEKRIGLDTVVVATKDQVSADLAGEAAILNLTSGIYYGLNEVGASIWKLVREPRTVNEVKDTLLHEYVVEPEQCESDLTALLEELLSRGLIEVIPPDLPKK